MFVELAALGALYWGYDRIKNIDMYHSKDNFIKIMKDNNLDYKVLKVNKNDYGFKIVVDLNGKGFEKLKKCKDYLETIFGYRVEVQQSEKNLCIAIIHVLRESLDNLKFKPKYIKPFEIYVGLNFRFEPLIVDIFKFPHILISGQTGSGKTELIRLILTNLISNFTDRDINIYFSDLSDMYDYECFQNCKQVKGYARNIKESEKLFNYLIHVYKKRLNIFGNGGCKNIKEYNKRNYFKRMSYNYIVLDEMADYFPTNKLEVNYEEKVQCYNLLRPMVRKFRKVGIFFIIGIQRPDTTVLDPSLKANLCTKIGFSQTSDASSLVICDTKELTDIENRKALFMHGNVKEWMKSLYIDDDLIEEYIKNSIVENRIEQLDYNKFLFTKESPNIDIKSQKNDNTINIAKINTKKKRDKTKTKSKVKINAIN